MADLPADPDPRAEALDFLKSRGIDGVILFRPMLLELVERIDVKKTYEKSDLLQILRILKNYDLLKSGQMDLFAHVPPPPVRPAGPPKRRRMNCPSPRTPRPTERANKESGFSAAARPSGTFNE